MIHFIQLKFAESCRYKLGKEKIQEEITSVKDHDYFKSAFNVIHCLGSLSMKALSLRSIVHKKNESWTDVNLAVTLELHTATEPRLLMPILIGHFKHQNLKT